MVKQLLEEVRSAPLDEASRRRLREIHERTIKELEDGLAPELVEELDRMTLPFGEDDVPSDAELRIAQAQLVGWLEGLFHGIQTDAVRPADGGPRPARADAPRAAGWQRSARDAAARPDPQRPLPLKVSCQAEPSPVTRSA